MSNKSKVKSTIGNSDHRRKKSTTSNNLNLSPSLVGKFRKFVRRKQKSQYSKSTLNPESPRIPDDAKLTFNLPKDAAVHFGAFYGVQGNNANEPRVGRVKNFIESTGTSYKSTPRLEFTRQMVQKLERTAGTEEYARQVSALLEETVEPAHFKLHSLPVENSIPDGRYSPSGFPLWYKDPYKMPLGSDEMYKVLQERFDNTETRAKDIFGEESSEKNSLEEASEYDEDDEEMNTKNFFKGEKSSLNFLSMTESSSVTEAKDTDSKESN